MNRRVARAIVTLSIAGGVTLATGAHASAGERQGPPSGALLDVPYLTQTPELCGGAAVAMVMRYWGARDVFAQDFAPLVGPHDGGIRSSVLAAAVRARGWQALVPAVPVGASRARLRSEVDRGRPVIALIEAAPRTYHYVVIVGSTDQEVVLHDPARAPFRVTPWAEFDRAWAAADHWMLLALPPPAGAASITTPSPAPVDTATAPAATPCRDLVGAAVRLARAGERAAAEHSLLAATRLCPADQTPWRELAGLRFSESRWPEAAALAATAVRLAPADAYAWQVLATSRYLGGDRTGALEAWNQVDEPRIESIDILGAERTPHPVLVRALRLHPRQLLTRSGFEQASRRLADVPVVSRSRLTYEPTDDGRAGVRASFTERSLMPRGWTGFAAMGARALVQHDARAGVVGTLGAGEVIAGSWRWAGGRPRVAFRLEAPSPGWLPGVVAVNWSWERQSYAAPAGHGAAAVSQSTRRRAAVSLSDWAAGWARWQAGVALDRFGMRDTAAFDAGLDVRAAQDRVAVVTSGGWWLPLRGHGRFMAAGLLGAWRSTTDVSAPGWSADAGIRAASRRAPVDLWEGAGTGQGRDGLLRAHPLLEDGVLAGPVFGRTVVRASLEYARPVAGGAMAAVRVAGFVDAARAWHRLDGSGPSPLHIDVGAGVRVHAPGSAGTIRVDVAQALRGGGVSFSAGWSAGWPR